MASNSTRTELFPWHWTLTATDPTAKCPSASWVLGTLALVNVAVTLLSVLSGNRYVLKWLTFNRFFKEKHSNAWKWTWMINVGLQLAANALIGWIFQQAPGYQANFKIWELMLFFTVRPRLSWVALGFLAQVEQHDVLDILPSRRRRKRSSDSGDKAAKGRSKEVDKSRAHPAQNGDPDICAAEEGRLEVDGIDKTTQKDGPVVAVTGEREKAKNRREEEEASFRRKDFPWHSAAKSQALAEIALNVIALYIMGRTAHFAAVRGYYLVGTKKYKDLPHSAHLMYAGALFYMVGGSFMLSMQLGALIMEIFNDEDKIGFTYDPEVVTVWVSGVLLYSWMGNWLFWAGFVRSAGNLYCPPKLYAQGAIWAVFALLGTMVGAGGG